jgi:hypothetical protein
VKVDNNTVGLIPRIAPKQRVAGVERSESPENTQPDDAQLGAHSIRPQPPELMLHLVFDKAGRLIEKRMVEQTSGNILHTVRVSADGEVSLLDKEGDIVVAQQWKRAACDAPNLSPTLEDLVVLPLPYRSVGHNNKSDDHIRQLADNLAAHNGPEVVRIIREHFFKQNDHRAGFYVLLSRFPRLLIGPGSIPNKDTFDLRPSAESSPLLQFVRQWINLQRKYADAQELEIDAPADSFLQRIATARNLYARWNGGIATKGTAPGNQVPRLSGKSSYAVSGRQDEEGSQACQATIHGTGCQRPHATCRFGITDSVPRQQGPEGLG